MMKSARIEFKRPTCRRNCRSALDTRLRVADVARCDHGRIWTRGPCSRECCPTYRLRVWTHPILWHRARKALKGVDRG